MLTLVSVTAFLMMQVESFCPKTRKGEWSYEFLELV